MKKLLILAIAFGLTTMFGTVSMAIDVTTDYAVGADAGGIALSRHNVGAYGKHFRTSAVSNSSSLGTTEICVFCHTPHHGTTNAPLWNKGQQTTTYTAYGSTIGGTNITNSSIGAATLACLSCHDGVNTFDTLVNAPGKGNNGSNSASSLSGVDMGWIFIEDGDTKSDYMTSWRLNVGTDLTNDHPVSVTYSDTKASLRPTNTNIAELDMEDAYADTTLSGGHALVANAGADALGTHSDNKWSIKGQIDDGTATIADLLRNGKVECSSCHDPHFKNLSWTEAEYTWSTTDETEGDGLFLRRVGGNSLSGVCRTCHNK
ncbi:MAG: hypothetical protein HY880_09090 [Deltaproteobacteria bacterium]|nr:hypothetical protein [Deltaproteobacteria bacterium]